MDSSQIAIAANQAAAFDTSSLVPTHTTAFGRDAPFSEEPGFYEPAQLWLYGNVRLLGGDLAFVEGACRGGMFTRSDYQELAQDAEYLVLKGKILVVGIHNDQQQQVAVIPLRFGAPRIVVFSGGFRRHLGDKLDQEPFRAGRLWRYGWDPKTDLAVSRRAPDKLPTFARHNPTVDRLIEQIATKACPGLELFTS